MTESKKKIQRGKQRERVGGGGERDREGVRDRNSVLCTRETP